MEIGVSASETDNYCGHRWLNNYGILRRKNCFQKVKKTNASGAIFNRVDV